MRPPRLVAVAHGSRNPAAQRAVEALVATVRRRLPTVETSAAYVELAEPDLASVMASAGGPSVVVPLLLSTGHHVRHDLPEAVRCSRFPTVLARPLGPHRLLAAATVLRLRAARAGRGDAVVLVAAGSNDADALVDTSGAGRLLAAHWGAPVDVAHLSGPGRRLPAVMEELRAAGRARVAVAPYLLAPGHFAAQAREVARLEAATAVADVLGDHPLVAELVVRRYLAGVRTLATGSSTTSGRRPSRVA